MSATYHCLPLGEFAGEMYSLWISPRGSEDVPCIATRGCKQQADLSFAMPRLSTALLETWAKTIETAMDLERKFKPSKDLHQTRIRTCAVMALAAITAELESREQRGAA